MMMIANDYYIYIVQKQFIKDDIEWNKIERLVCDKCFRISE